MNTAATLPIWTLDGTQHQTEIIHPITATLKTKQNEQMDPSHPPATNTHTACVRVCFS